MSEVACGLRRLGHTVHVIARVDGGHMPRKLECGTPLHYSRWPKEAAMLGLPQVSRAVRAFRPDVVMERFYNFAGAGVFGAVVEEFSQMCDVAV